MINENTRFRIGFGIEELVEEKFLSVVYGQEVTIGKAKLIEALKRQYDICLKWIEMTIYEK